MTVAVTKWIVPGDSEARVFDTRELALVRAWDLTPAGGQRKEPVPWTDPKTVITQDPAASTGVVPSPTDPEVHYLTWVYHLINGEEFSPRIMEKGKQVLTEVAKSKGWKLVEGTFRYNNASLKKVSFYADAMTAWERGDVITNGVGEKVIYDGEQWTLHDTTRGRSIARSVRFEKETADMRYGMISDE